MPTIASAAAAFERFSSLDVIDTVARFVDRDVRERWGVYQSSGEGGPIAELAETIEQAVFDDEYQISAEAMRAEFGPYNRRSVWNLIVNHETMEPVGSVRHIVGPARSFKGVDDLATHWGLAWDDVADAAGFDPHGQFFEACTYSIIPKWRTADRGWPAKVAMSVQSHTMTELASQASLQIINPRALRVFKRWGVPFVPIADPTDIEGFDFQPVFIPNIPGTPWMASQDAEFVSLFLHRDTNGRGGTRLDPVRAGEPTVVQAHNAAMFAADAVNVW